MRILHTSDWHLGRSFHREGMLGHQATWVDHLIEVVESERVDLVVVAGDVYDRALPPVDAVRLADEALVRLARSRAAVVLTSGNHDSAQRLGFSSRLIDAAGVHLRTDIGEVGTPVLLHDEHGPVAVHGIPYLDPHAVAEPWALNQRSHQAALNEAMSRVRRDLAGRPATRSVVLAHAFVAGAEPSDSERDITVGGVARVPTTVFDGVDYVALGHLHGPHVLSDTVRYSGSPLAYSFSEAGHVKGSWLVELGADGLGVVVQVPSPPARALSLLRGPLADLLVDAALEPRREDWLSVVLTDAVRPDDAMQRLRTRFPHVLVLEWRPEGAVADERSYTARTADRSDLDVVAEFVRHVRAGGAASEAGAIDDAERALLQQALEAGRLAAASG